MEKRKISIVFCGGCNPKINRKEIAESLVGKMAEKGYEIVFNTLFADYIVYLSGCACNCACQSKKQDTACVVIAGEYLNFSKMGKDELMKKALLSCENF